MATDLVLIIGLINSDSDTTTDFQTCVKKDQHEDNENEKKLEAEIKKQWKEKMRDEKNPHSTKLSLGQLFLVVKVILKLSCASTKLGLNYAFWRRPKLSLG